MRIATPALNLAATNLYVEDILSHRRMISNLSLFYSQIFCLKSISGWFDLRKCVTCACSGDNGFKRSFVLTRGQVLGCSYSVCDRLMLSDD